ncbi:60 kDa jasmonate-induced protein-like isoform X2 [Triticum dicoccoides]|uniref:60 kDa jasmonate-induced protein-like isoform X2 n=1 Tax=Triticum dicoccoides TaxID=85692 RepID=UPI001891A87F|nr:60 kDa jasmonate-induced protein-like isoform X2 [Triticum dicoccoides]
MADDAPTDEQLLSYADLPKSGRDMAEVFAVRVPDAAGGRRPPPCGIISFHGGNCCSDVIYSRSRPDEPSCPQGNIVLTGPSVATSAYGPVVFNLQLHDNSQESPSQQDKEEEEEDTGRLLCDTVGGSFSNYNRAIVETASTRYGPADVTYAVLSNGVEGRVTVKLACLDGEGPAGVLGRIVARSKLFNAGCVLFCNEHGNGNNMRVGSGELVPLARHVLAVPLHMPLTVELDLRRDSGDEIVRGAVAFHPATDGQHMERVMGAGGAVIEVSISWSDYPWYCMPITRPLALLIIIGKDHK